MSKGVCFECEKRRLGCRTDCPDWAVHEAAKAERYAKHMAAIDGMYTSPRIARLYDTKKREIKTGRRVK